MVRIEVDDNGVIRDCECTGNSFGVAIQICGACVISTTHSLMLTNNRQRNSAMRSPP